MEDNDSPELLKILDDLDARLQRGEPVDVAALERRHPEFAAQIRAHAAVAALTTLPDAPDFAPTPAEQVEAWRRADRQKFLELAAAEPLPRVSAWTRLRRAVPRVLEDLAAFSVRRGARPVYVRSSPLAQGSKGIGGEADLEPGAGALVELEPVRSGDQMNVHFSMPRAGALVVLLQAGDRLSVVYPGAQAGTAGLEAGTLEAGAQVQLPLTVTGSPGDAQELAFLVVPGAAVTQLEGRSADDLIGALAGVGDATLRRYRFRIEG